MSLFSRASHISQHALTTLGDYLAGLVLRLFLAYEFADSGLTKLTGPNWFGEIQGQFPYPLTVIPTELSWFLATWSELLGAALLLVGFATRSTSAVLIILTAVAWYTVHAGYGYNVCSNGYQLPLIFIVALIPLLTQGPGKLSLDHWLARQRP